MLSCFCLLLAASLSTITDAARSLQQRREQPNPYLLLPPGFDNNVGGRKPAESLGEKSFSLRHIYHHGSQKYPQLHRFLDVPKSAQLRVTDDFGETSEHAPTDLRVQATTSHIERLTSRRRHHIDEILDYAAIHGEAMPLPATAWRVDEVAGPNVTDKGSVLTFARMALNAYITTPLDGEWQDVKGGYNYTDDFGWEADGLRGHIFADQANGTVVIGLKGTSPAVFDGSDTTGNDKLNDNLFGSCCCGQGGQLMWKQVCDCMTSAYTCNNTCLVKSLRQKSHYYWAVRDLYHNVTERYPNADVWISGHSLGGVVSSLLGLTYGLPTMTFEAFPDALGAQRLGLPTPPGYKIGSHQTRADLGIHHFGHTADPIFMGTCNAGTSFCTIAGYAFQGVCHTGQTCVYDTVGDFGWRVGIGTHKISNVIKDVILKYDTVPSCDMDVDCQDCFNWKFFESNGTESTTSSKISTKTRTVTRTRTETCKTPGWWGCLDESTTTSATTTTSSTSTSSTSTCKTPGWFGCNDATTTLSSSRLATMTPAPAPAPAPTVTVITTTTTTPSATSSSSSTTCKTPGWFGCNDHTVSSTSTAKPRPSHTLTESTPAATQHSCTSKEWFGLICVDPSPTDMMASFPLAPTLRTSATSILTAGRKTCLRRHWYGTCIEWSVVSGMDAQKKDL